MSRSGVGDEGSELPQRKGLPGKGLPGGGLPGDGLPGSGLPGGGPDRFPDVVSDGQWRRQVRRRLLTWFRKNARDLPWRRNPTPYRVWVSEIMLQQTQVATVVPYYRRFLKTFPSVRKLAMADLQTVLKHWEGLGYYRRARMMHEAAKQIVHQHGGRFPDSFEKVLALPGIGRYTAGAILSIARDQRLPILEGNTQRVFSRWVALVGHPSEKPVSDQLWQIATQMLPRNAPGEFNQAAMELGALICTPKQPSCGRCPVMQNCLAANLELQNVIPGKVSRMHSESRTEYAFLVTDPSHCEKPTYLVRRMSGNQRWAGLWDFPRSVDGDAESPAAAADQLSIQIGGRIVPGKRITTINHVVTRFRIQLHIHHARFDPPSGSLPAPWKFVTVGELQSMPMSVTGRHMVACLDR